MVFIVSSIADKRQERKRAFERGMYVGYVDADGNK